MNLLSFVKEMPSDLVVAPIYKKGTKMLSGREATGKNPLESSFKRKFTPADAAYEIEKNPNLRAIGVFTGIRGSGIVILDVDRNLSALKKKWGDTLNDTPCVTSTRKNAAKYLFRIPSDLWGQVQGHGLSEATGGCYEILWGRQGLVFGEYPGGKVSEPGFYGFEGDLNDIKIAPDWLLSEMKAAKAGDGEGIIKNRRALELSDRTEDEIAQITQECLSVLPPQGTGSRDHWVKVGMAIHAALPNDLGLTLWSAWSAKDPEYADEWEKGNPCEGPWQSFKPGAVNFGSLIWEADQQDPTRARFPESSRKILEAAESRQIQEIRNTTIPFGELIQKAQEALELENPAEMNYTLHALAIRAGYRDQASLEKLIVDQLQFDNATELLSIEELMALKDSRGYLIPDVLPTPSVVLMYGAGGDGKSMSAWALAKHIATGEPFVVRGRQVPVEQGNVLLLNGDQPLIQLKEQLQEIDYPVDEHTHIQTDWNMQRYCQFAKLMNKQKPKLVVIDSLIGCSGGRAFDENKSDFAQPIYWLTRNNGILWPPATIVLIHHANKKGGKNSFRGTSSIRDAVDETFSLTMPDEKVMETDDTVGTHCRVIHIEKSRSGRSGTSLIMKMEDDLSFTISDYTPEIDDEDKTPASIHSKVLQRLRIVYPNTRTRADINADPLVGGQVGAIKKSLQRLEKRGLITSTTDKGVKSYKAVLARGEDGTTPPKALLPSGGTGSRWGQQGGQSTKSSTVVPPKKEGDKSPSCPPSCPPTKPSAQLGSTPEGTNPTYLPARAHEERTPEELAKLKQQAWDAWG